MSDATPASPATGALMTRAALPGLLFGLIGGAGVAFSGIVPEDVGIWPVVGGAVAGVVGMIGVVLKCRAAFAPVDAAGAQNLGVAILGDFVILLFTFGAVLGGMFFSGLKFNPIVGFALAFATVALVHQLASAFVLARELKRRESLRTTDSPPSSSSGQSPR